jgi:hypothetical protein
MEKIINPLWRPYLVRGGYYALNYALHNNLLGVINYINSHYINFPWRNAVQNQITMDEAYTSIRDFAVSSNRKDGFVWEILSNVKHNDLAPGDSNIYKSPNAS